MLYETNNTWIVGAGGIGVALYKELKTKGFDVTIITRKQKLNFDAEFITLDTSDDRSTFDFIRGVKILPKLIIVTTGILHKGTLKPEKTILDLNKDNLITAIDSNLMPSLNIAKSISKRLTREDSIKMICFSARVASIEDNSLGGWYSYRMSKAALNMMVKNIAIEWKLKSPQSSIVGYHPGTVQTDLSAPYIKNKDPNNIFSPDKAANYCLEFINSVDHAKSGQLFDWRKEVIPY